MYDFLKLEQGQDKNILLSDHSPHYHGYYPAVVAW